MFFTSLELLFFLMSGLHRNDSTIIRHVFYNCVMALGSGGPKHRNETGNVQRDCMTRYHRGSWWGVSTSSGGQEGTASPCIGIPIFECLERRGSLWISQPVHRPVSTDIQKLQGVVGNRLPRVSPGCHQGWEAFCEAGV